MIHISVDFPAFNQFFDDVGKQANYAASRALNDTALGIQNAEQASITEHFTLRRPEWTLQGVKIPKFSNKNDTPLSITVKMDQGAGRGDIMTKFETGGTKTPRGSNLAIPIMARPSRGQIIPAGLRPKALGLHAVGRSMRGDQRTFMLPLKNGHTGIFQRTSGGTIRLLYFLKPTAPLPASLHFYDTASQPLIDQLFALNFEERFAEAMRTAR